MVNLYTTVKVINPRSERNGEMGYISGTCKNSNEQKVALVTFADGTVLKFLPHFLENCDNSKDIQL